MTQITVEVPDTLSLGRNGRIGQLSVDWSKVPQHVLDHIAKIYFSQYITDKANSGGKDESMANRYALAEKKLAAMYAGHIRTRTAEDTPVDPVEAQAWILATAFFNAQYKSLLDTCPKGTKDRVLYLINLGRVQASKEAFASRSDLYETFFALESEKAKDIWKSAEETVANAKQSPTTILADLGL